MYKFFCGSKLGMYSTFPPENHDSNLQKDTIFAAQKTDSCLAGCRWSYATKGHEGLSSLRSLGLVIRRQGGKKNSATINDHKSSSINIQTSLLMTSTGGISVTRWELDFFEIFPAVGLRMNRGGCFIHLGLISL